jgi:hypothetical protein
MCRGIPCHSLDLLFFWGPLQLIFVVSWNPVTLVSTILQAAGDCGLEPVAYEFFTQAFVLYEEEISVSHEADATHCDVQLAHSKEIPCLLLCCCVGIAGFQGPSDCPSTHYWHIAKNTGVWS